MRLLDEQSKDAGVHSADSAAGRRCGTYGDGGLYHGLGNHDRLRYSYRRHGRAIAILSNLRACARWGAWILLSGENFKA